MVDKALSLGFSGLAFTDHEALSAAVEILKARDAIRKDHPDFKIIFGNEIYLIDQTEVGQTRDFYHFILLAKDLTGWDQLRALSSRAWERGYVDRGQRRVPTTYQDLEEIVKANPGHLLASTACLGGRLAKAILAHDVQGANEFVRWCIDVFGSENFALELQPANSDEQIQVNHTLLRFSQYYNIPYIITTDSHYLNKEDFVVHSAFLNSKQTTDRETDKFYRFTYMMSLEEMREILQASGLTNDEIERGFQNTVELTAAMEDYDFRHGTIVPRIKIPDFQLSKILYAYDGYPAIRKQYDSADDQDRYLMYQIEQGLQHKHVTITTVILERIDAELDILQYISEQIGQNLSSYLNLTVNIVDIAWQVSLVGTGRGSACGFYINYLIGITQADPLQYNLAHWRFLNKERAELPDVDEDFQPEKTDDIVRLLREAYGEDNVLNCATFKTESLKSAILSCGRGLGYNNDEMQALAALVPEHRGHFYTLDECLVGDTEKGFDPVPGFEGKFVAYPGLLEAVRKIEGLPTNSSIHASALYVFNNGFLAQNSMMRAPNGTKITAFNMHDSDDLGALKMDVLRTDAQSKIAKCMELLLADQQMEWKGSLRATYDYYLHPDVLQYDNPQMWADMADGKIANLFQFETQVGAVCIKKARPTDVMELAEINSIMRLQADEGEQPIDRYVRFRNNPVAWDLEMIEEGLTTHEMDILKKYLSGSHGVSGSQEVLMRILMDPEVCGFTLGESNAARKAIAKKIATKLIQLKADFYEKGGQRARKEFLDYVWTYCIEPQLGYSFSINHTLPYSLIALQEANLATRWDPLYWKCACLCVNSGSYVGAMGDEDDEADDSEGVDESADGKRHVAPNYGKISRAITDAQRAGVNIELPDINRAQADFVPDIENQSILYSLRAVTVVGDNLLAAIIAGRPYQSMQDFVTRVQPTRAQMIGLIKAGCFDALEGQPRMRIMTRYLQQLADEDYPLKDKLTLVQIRKAIDMGWTTPEFAESIRILKFKQYVEAHCQDTENKRLLLSDDKCIKFFEQYIMNQLNLTKGEYSVLPGGRLAVKLTAFRKVITALLAPVVEYFNTEAGRQAYKDLLQGAFLKEMWETKCAGSISRWEMETLNFYYSGHELRSVGKAKYGIGSFFALPERGDNPRMIALVGTVTDTNNTRHTISLLTPEEGVVDVKFYGGTYAQYNQRISIIDAATQKKTVVDESWLKRGTLLLIYGIRKENMFHARTDRSGPLPRTIGLIEQIHSDGTLGVRYARRRKVESK